MKLPRQKRDETSAALTQTLWLIVICSGLFVLTAYASDPSWWSSTGTGTQSAVICPPQVVTNSGIVTTNYVRNDYAVVTQGQLKHFTIRAVDYLNATLPAGAGSNLDTMVSNWAQDYLTNGYATNPANPTLPYKPSDLQAENVGQLKYIAGLVDAQLAVGGYTGLYPAWIVQNTNTDGAVANLGQLKEVFNFDLSAAPPAVTNLVATMSNPDEIDLSWTLPAMNNAQSLSIEESTDGGSTWTTVATLDATATSYAVTSLDPAGSYEFAVVSGNTSSSNETQSTASSSTSTNQPPPAPSRYVVIDLGTNFAPAAINNSNVVAGNIGSIFGGTAAIWSSGSLTNLPPSPNGTGTAYGISDSGVIVGQADFYYSGPGTNLIETHACSWANATASPTDLDTQQGDPDSAHNIDNYYLIPYHSLASCINSNGIYGWWYDQGYSASQFSALTGASSPNPAIGAAWVITSATGTNYCGDYESYATNGAVINGEETPPPDPAYTNFFLTAINASGLAIGGEYNYTYMGGSPYFYPYYNFIRIVPVLYQNGTNTVLAAAGAQLCALNNQMTTNGTPTPQIVGFDSTGTNAALWDYTTYSGTTTSNYVQKNLNFLIPGGSNTNNPPWQINNALGVNNAGAIIATMYDTNNVAHGGLLLPCQFRLLNGAQSGPDGMDFNGNRPTTVSATSNYATSTMVANTEAIEGTNTLGAVTLGQGLTVAPFAGNSYVYSLMMLAKVSPPAATNITYAWGRVYQGRDVTIINTPTATNSYWDVSGVISHTGFPTPYEDTGSSSYYTTSPSTNNNVLAFADAPGAYLVNFNNNNPKVGDYAYQKKVFTYYVTNYIGSATAVGIQQIGTDIVAQRTATNGVVATDWSGIENIASTTNMPDCTNMTTAEIRAIVGGTNLIVIEPSATSNYP